MMASSTSTAPPIPTSTVVGGNNTGGVVGFGVGGMSSGMNPNEGPGRLQLRGSQTQVLVPSLPFPSSSNSFDFDRLFLSYSKIPPTQQSSMMNPQQLHSSQHHHLSQPISQQPKQIMQMRQAITSPPMGGLPSAQGSNPPGSHVVIQGGHQPNMGPTPHLHLRTNVHPSSGASVVSSGVGGPQTVSGQQVVHQHVHPHPHQHLHHPSHPHAHHPSMGASGDRSLLQQTSQPVTGAIPSSNVQTSQGHVHSHHHHHHHLQTTPPIPTHHHHHHLSQPGPPPPPSVQLPGNVTPQSPFMQRLSSSGEGWMLPQDDGSGYSSAPSPVRSPSPSPAQGRLGASTAAVAAANDAMLNFERANTHSQSSTSPSPGLSPFQPTSQPIGTGGHHISGFPGGNVVPNGTNVRYPHLIQQHPGVHQPHASQQSQSSHLQSSQPLHLSGQPPTMIHGTNSNTGLSHIAAGQAMSGIPLLPGTHLAPRVYKTQQNTPQNHTFPSLPAPPTTDSIQKVRLSVPLSTLSSHPRLLRIVLTIFTCHRCWMKINT
jgi:hypothetical protein